MTHNRISAEDARQGETTGRIRNVLVVSVLLAALALLIAALQFGAS